MADIVVSYKGRNYLQKFRGKTKYGMKCKLSFMDGSKEFWVDADLVSAATSQQSSTRSRGYADDGYYTNRKGETLAKGCADCRALGRMCDRCRHDYE